MPRGNRTGPGGMGPMTGRSAGYCAGYDVPGYMNPGVGAYGRMGRGMAWRRGGFGGGYRGWAPPPPPYYGAPYGPGYPPLRSDPEAEKEFLQGEVKNLENQLSGIQKRLNELESESKAQE